MGRNSSKMSSIDRRDLDNFKYLLKSNIKNMPPQKAKIWLTEISDLCKRLLNNEE